MTVWVCRRQSSITTGSKSGPNKGEAGRFGHVPGYAVAAGSTSGFLNVPLPDAKALLLLTRRTVAKRTRMSIETDNTIFAGK
jgi:hypothetical protein